MLARPFNACLCKQAERRVEQLWPTHVREAFWNIPASRPFQEVLTEVLMQPAEQHWSVEHKNGMHDIPARS